MIITAQSRSSPIAQFWIPGRGVGKSRPKLHWHNGEVFPDYSRNYKEWMNFAKGVIRHQSKSYPSVSQPVEIVSSFVNFLSSDVDNLQGAVLDAMTGNYLQGDSASFVTGSRGKFCKTTKHSGTKEIGILVEVYPGGIRSLEPGFSDRLVLPEFLATSPLSRSSAKTSKKTSEKLLRQELTKPPLKISLSEPGLIAEFWIPGKGVGKARPYLHWHQGKLIKTYSKSYTTWMDYARNIIRYYERSYAPAPKPARVEVACVNYASSDIDNLQGSPLDALTKIYLEGDSSSCVCSSAAEFFKARKRRGKEREQGTWIKIFKGEVETLFAGFSAAFDLPRQPSFSITQVAT